MMAIRNLLHTNKLLAFEEYLESLDYMILPTVGDYEVLRARKGKDSIIVYKKADSSEHVSIMDKDYKIVRSFLKGLS